MANEWNEWRQHILISMEKQETELKGLREEVSNIKQEIAMLKVKSGMWGALAGAIPVIIMLAIQAL